MSHGRAHLRLKAPWDDGTHHLLFEPTELIERLAALVPRPYTNLILYHGVLSPNAKWRSKVVRFARARTKNSEASPHESPPVRSANLTWAELMRRGLDIDALECEKCGGRLRFIAAILETAVVCRILAHLGLPSEPVRFAAARAPPESDELWAS